MTGYDKVRPIAVTAGDNLPVVGETAEGLAEYFVRTGKLANTEACDRVRRDALTIVQRCRRFTDPDGDRVGLVVGYVQSGKTMSMEMVSALARDNGCRIVILLAGVTKNLLQQNASRLRTDLRAASGKATAWRIFNSQDGLGEHEHLERAIHEWKDPDFSSDKQTFLYMVLKNHAHLDRLSDLLAKVAKKATLRGVPALILDDEADQASLNTTPQQEDPSTTYRKILRVRSLLPHHTYLQYTATPQAPLLIALDDMLSPAFAELVQPGDGYTGGATFFGPGSRQGLVKSIPEQDLFRPGSPPDEMPESLLEALRIFFVGCAVASVRGRPSPRSMLVHPSPRTADHTRYLSWITKVIDRWSTTLRCDDEDERRDTLDEFRSAYADLSRTDEDLPPFEALLLPLKISLGRVSQKEVNSSDGSEIDWENADEHILVGGEKLNRGFTVEGLTVTYMPRDAGDWNADTIQQRARFFGYKSKYLSLCRLYLHADVIAAYRGYVVHEDHIRRQLAEYSGRPLRDWRRAFFLNGQMRPTRRNVLSASVQHELKRKLWFTQERPHHDLDAIARNRRRCDKLLEGRKLDTAEGFFKHACAEVSLGTLFRDFLVEYEVREGDRPAWYAQLVVLADLLDPDSPNAMMPPEEQKALLVVMAVPRERTPGADGAITLQQGRTSSDKVGGYPGDAKMIDANIVTVQVHWVDILNDGPKRVPALAIHIPANLRTDDVVVQRD